MRILFLHRNLDQSGSVANSFNMVRGLLKRGHRLQVMAYRGIRAREFSESGIPVAVVKPCKSPLVFSRRFRHVLERARGFNPDIIQVEHVSQLKVGHRVAELLKKPLVFIVHSYLKPREFLKTEPMKNVKIVTVSQALRAYLVNSIKIPKESISILQDGIDISLYAIDFAEQQVPDRAMPTVGMCGNYKATRGHDCFLEAARRLKEQEREVLFFIAGYGKGDKPIKRKARELGLLRDVTFIHDFPDIRKVLGLFDIYALPSRAEGLGYRALEAMAMAKPVVASSVGGLMDVVRDEETGLLFQPGNAEKLAEKIAYFLDKPEEIQRMGDRGKEVITTDFASEAMVKGMEDIYKNLM